MIKYLLLCLISTLSVFAGEGTFFLLLGPSGGGKSTIIHHLQKMDSRFVYVSPYTTRDLRPGETDKIHVNLETIHRLEQQRKLLTVNKIYGIYYATPRDVIDTAIAKGQFPILDWPVDMMRVILDNYAGKVFTVYIEPDSLDELARRLAVDGRDKDGRRFAAGKEELAKYHRGEFDAFITMKIINNQGKDREVAERIYETFLRR